MCKGIDSFQDYLSVTISHRCTWPAICGFDILGSSHWVSLCMCLSIISTSKMAGTTYRKQSQMRLTLCCGRWRRSFHPYEPALPSPQEEDQGHLGVAWDVFIINTLISLVQIIWNDEYEEMIFSNILVFFLNLLGTLLWLGRGEGRLFLGSTQVVYN